MTTKEKNEIARMLEDYCGQKGSQNKAANSLKNISAATVSQMLSGAWELISDEMWRNVAGQIGYERRKWKVARTSGFGTMEAVLKDAQTNSLVFAVIGSAGCGKSESIKIYARKHKNVIHMSCNEYWNKRAFLRELILQLGGTWDSADMGGLMHEAIRNIKRRENPLLVLDEADKLSDSILYFFITLYNNLEDRCGMVLCATDYLEKRIRRGMVNNRKGYEEIYSRISRKFVGIPQVNDDDIAAVCAANGVTDERTVMRIIDDSEYDLRRVRRLVYASRKEEDGDGKAA